MRRTIFHKPYPAHDESRRGTATVEFAVTAPLFLIILLGMVEMSRALDISQRLSNAVREGGRAAASDLRERLPAGWTLNQKITADVRNMLIASGLNGADVTIAITHAEGDQAGKPFDLSKADNSLGYFQISASIPYQSVGVFPVRIMQGRNLSASVVFRLGKSALSS